MNSDDFFLLPQKFVFVHCRLNHCVMGLVDLCRNHVYTSNYSKIYIFFCVRHPLALSRPASARALQNCSSACELKWVVCVGRCDFVCRYFPILTGEMRYLFLFPNDDLISHLITHTCRTELEVAANKAKPHETR